MTRLLLIHNHRVSYLLDVPMNHILIYCDKPLAISTNFIIFAKKIND